jgi:fibronectin-binding autotransporter adhesin
MKQVAIICFAVLSVFIFSNKSSATTFTLKTASVATASTAASWNTDASGAGAGTNATNFTGVADIFIILVAQTANFQATITFATSQTLQVDGNITIPNAVVLTAPNTVTFSKATTTQVTTAGSGSFVLIATATLRTVNTNGLRVANGTFAAAATATFNAGATYEFSATANQAMTGLPATVGNLIISGSNAAIKTLPATTTVSTALTVRANTILASGGFNLQPSSVALETLVGSTGSTISGAGILTLTGNVTLTNSGGTATTGAVISMNISTTAVRSFTVADDGSSASTDLLLSGVVAGAAGGITKLGTGTMAVSGLNTFTGAVTITAGVLSINTIANAGSANFSALGTGTGTAAITIGSTGTLRYTGGVGSTARAIALATASGGSIDASGSGTLTMSGGVSGNTFGLVLTGTGTGIYSGIIATTSGTLTKTGTGTWTVSGTNTFSGQVIISNGVLATATVANAATASPLGNGNTTPTISISSSGTLRYTGIAGSSTRAFVLTGGGATIENNNTAGTLTLSGGITGNTFGVVLAGTGTGVFSGAIATTTGTFTKDGTGTWTVSGTSTFSGAVTVTDGVLVTATLVSAGTNSPLGNGNTTPAISIGATGTLQYTGATVTCSRPFVITGSGGTIEANNTGTLTLTGGVTGTNLSMELSGTGIAVMNSVIATGTGGVLKTAAGSWTLSGSNTFSGSMNISAGTIIANTMANAGTNSSLGTGNTVAIITMGAASTLQYTGAATSTDRDFTLTGAATINGSGSGALTMNGDISATNFGLTLTGTATGNIINGIIGTGTGTLTKASTSTWQLSGLNTFSGAVTISAGILIADVIAAAGNASSFGTGATTPAISIVGGATLRYTGATAATTGRVINLITADGSIIDVAGTGDLEFTGGVTGTFDLVLTGSSTGIGTINSVIATGTTSTLTKNGTGTWELLGLNSFGSDVTISAGTLVANTIAAAGANSSLGTGSTTPAIAIAATATLKLEGAAGTYTTARAITIGNGTTIDVTGAGTFFLNGNITGTAAALVLTGTGNGVINGVIGTTTGALTKNGSGNWQLGGNNTYSGVTTISSGGLYAATNVGVSTAGAFGNSAGAVILGNANTVTSGSFPSLFLASGGTLLFARPITIANFIPLVGNYAVGGSADNNATITGAITFSQPFNVEQAATTSTNKLTISGNITGGLAGNKQVTFNNIGQVLVATGVISDGTGTTSLTKQNNGVLTISGTNTYTAGFTLTGGTLNINSVTALGTAAGTFTINGGTIQNTTGASITTNSYPIMIGGDFLFDGAQNLNLGTGTVTMAANRQINVDAGISLVIGGTLSAAASNLTKIGAGTLSFGANPVTLSSLTISAGVLTSTSGTLGIAGDLVNAGTFVHNSGTVDFNGAGAQNIGAANFNNLTISASKGGATITLISGGTISIAGTFTTTATNVAYVTTGNTVAFTATGTQTITAFNYNNLTITGARGTATLTLEAGTIGVAGTFNPGGVTGTITWVSTNNIFNYNGGSAQVIYAPFTYYDLVVSNAGPKSIQSGTVVTCRTVTINGTAELTVPSFANSIVVTL